MIAAPPPEPADEPDPEPKPRKTAGASRRGRGRWLRWQSLLAAVVAAIAAIVVALISRPSPSPQPPSPEPSPERASVVIVSTREDVDPAAPPNGLVVSFEGTVKGLPEGSTVFAMVRRADERLNWPSALAEVDLKSGHWKAVVHVARPRLPLEALAGVIPADADDIVGGGAGGTPPAATPPTALERLRRDGPDAAGVESTTPFRPVTPAATPTGR